MVFASAAAALTVRSTSRHGAGLSPDSSGYFRLANDVAANGLAFLAEDKSVTQPPLYPMLLALAKGATGASLAQVAAWSNALSAALVVALLLESARRCGVRPIGLAITGAIACGFAPFTAVWAMAWSEPAFLCCVAGCLLALQASGQSFRLVVTAGVLAAAASMVRYAGLVLMPVGFVWLLVAGGEDLRRRALRALCFVAIPALVLCSYFFRNAWVSGAMLGPRPRSSSGVLANFARMFEALGGWFVPLGAPVLASTAAFAVVLAVAISWRDRVVAMSAPARGGMLMHVAFSVVYAGFIVFTSSTVAYDPIDDRLMAPLAPSALIVLAVVLGAGPWRSRAVAAGVAALAATFAIGSMASSFSVVEANAQRGAGGFNLDQWHDSPLFARLRSEPRLLQGVVFSNVPDALHLLLGLEVRMAPARTRYNSADGAGVDASNLFVVHPELDEAMLVWREPNMREYLFTPGQLQSMCAVQELAQCADGSIYRVTRLRDDPRAPR